MKRFLVTFTVDVDSHNDETALTDALAVIVSAGRIDGFDAKVEKIQPEEEEEIWDTIE